MIRNAEDKYKRRKEEETQLQIFKEKKYKTRVVLSSKQREEREARYRQKLDFDKVPTHNL